MRCDRCDRDAEFVVHCPDEISLVCATHLERYCEYPFEQVGSSPLIRDSLNEAERILDALLAGKVVRFVHFQHPEVHWAIWDRERDCAVEKVVNSLTGETFGPFEFRKFQDYYELLGRAIASGWIAVVTNIQPSEILGGER
jgi:hypothetical protein